jgi:serine/threonine protein phosphatase PrpC
MTPELDFAGRQVKGTRKTQDDYYSFCPLTVDPDGLDGLLLVLADGMGGYAGGSLASRLVVDAFVEHFCFARGSIPSRLLGSLRASERRLREEIARRDESLNQMGSTLVGVLWRPGLLYWVSVGDSGLYLYRDKSFRRLNANHSMAPVLEAKAARGEMTAKDAATHPDRGILRSAIAVDPLELYELRHLPFKLEADDLVVVASDGLESTQPEVLTSTVQLNANKTAEEIVDALLDTVNQAQRQQQDNATVTVIRNSVTTV